MAHKENLDRLTVAYRENLDRLTLALTEEEKSSPYVIMHMESDRYSLFATANERDTMACWIFTLTKEFGYHYRVFYKAVSLLDSFFSAVKVKQVYVQCIATTCFYMAVKSELNSMLVNDLQEKIMAKCRVNFTQTDIQNTEAIIKQKLQSFSYRPTIDIFIKSFHSMGLASKLFHLPKNVSIESHLSRMCKSAQHIVCNHHLMKFKSSMLGLAILGCDLKMLDCDWLSTILSLQGSTQMRGGELSVCYEAIAAYYPDIASQYELAPPPPPQKPIRSMYGKVPTILDEEMAGDMPENSTDGGSGNGGIVSRPCRRRNRPRPVLKNLTVNPTIV